MEDVRQRQLILAQQQQMMAQSMAYAASAGAAARGLPVDPSYSVLGALGGPTPYSSAGAGVGDETPPGTSLGHAAATGVGLAGALGLGTLTFGSMTGGWHSLGASRGRAAIGLLDPMTSGMHGFFSGFRAPMAANGLKMTGAGSVLKNLGTLGFTGVARGVVSGVGRAAMMAAPALAVGSFVSMGVRNISAGATQYSQMQGIMNEILPATGIQGAPSGSEISNMLSQQDRMIAGSPNPAASRADVMGLMRTAGVNREFSDVRTVQGFQTKFATLVKETKAMATLMDTSLSEAYGMMKSFGQFGINTPGGQRAALGTSVFGAAGAGLSQQSVFQSMGVGMQLAGSLGMSRGTGAQVAGGASVGLGYAMLQNKSLESKVFELTGMGREQAASAMPGMWMQAGANIGQSPMMQYLLAGMVDQGGGLSEFNVSKYLTGSGDMKEFLKHSEQRMKDPRIASILQTNSKKLYGQLWKKLGTRGMLTAASRFGSELGMTPEASIQQLTGMDPELFDTLESGMRNSGRNEYESNAKGLLSKVKTMESQYMADMVNPKKIVGKLWQRAIGDIETYFQQAGRDIMKDVQSRVQQYTKYLESQLAEYIPSDVNNMLTDMWAGRAPGEFGRGFQIAGSAFSGATPGTQEYFPSWSPGISGTGGKFSSGMMGVQFSSGAGPSPFSSPMGGDYGILAPKGGTPSYMMMGSKNVSDLGVLTPAEARAQGGVRWGMPDRSQTEMMFGAAPEGGFGWGKTAAAYGLGGGFLKSHVGRVGRGLARLGRGGGAVNATLRGAGVVAKGAARYPGINLIASAGVGVYTGLQSYQDAGARNDLVDRGGYMGFLSGAQMDEAAAGLTVAPPVWLANSLSKTVARIDSPIANAAKAGAAAAISFGTIVVPERAVQNLFGVEDPTYASMGVPGFPGMAVSGERSKVEEFQEKFEGVHERRLESAERRAAAQTDKSKILPWAHTATIVAAGLVSGIGNFGRHVVDPSATWHNISRALQDGAPKADRYEADPSAIRYNILREMQDEIAGTGLSISEGEQVRTQLRVGGKLQALDIPRSEATLVQDTMLAGVTLSGGLSESLQSIYRVQDAGTQRRWASGELTTEDFGLIGKSMGGLSGESLAEARSRERLGRLSRGDVRGAFLGESTVTGNAFAQYMEKTPALASAILSGRIAISPEELAAPMLAAMMTGGGATAPTSQAGYAAEMQRLRRDAMTGGAENQARLDELYTNIIRKAGKDSEFSELLSEKNTTDEWNAKMEKALGPSWKDAVSAAKGDASVVRQYMRNKQGYVQAGIGKAYRTQAEQYVASWDAAGLDKRMKGIDSPALRAALNTWVGAYRSAAGAGSEEEAFKILQKADVSGTINTIREAFGREGIGTKEVTLGVLRDVPGLEQISQEMGEQQRFGQMGSEYARNTKDTVKDRLSAFEGAIGKQLGLTSAEMWGLERGKGPGEGAMKKLQKILDPEGRLGADAALVASLGFGFITEKYGNNPKEAVAAMEKFAILRQKGAEGGGSGAPTVSTTNVDPETVSRLVSALGGADGSGGLAGEISKLVEKLQDPPPLRMNISLGGVDIGETTATPDGYKKAEESGGNSAGRYGNR